MKKRKKERTVSERSGNVFISKEEPPQQCDECGKIAELRPYGKDGSCICFECAMKDPAGTLERCEQAMHGTNFFIVLKAPAPPG